MVPKKLSDNLIKVVSILSDRQYHDGTSIGTLLNMTRSAVWKTIKKLENYNVKIDSVKGKGYALLEPCLLLDIKKIKKHIKEKINILVFESIDSTQSYLKSYKHSKERVLCLTETQTQGKGRLNRTWHSPFGKNIYLSCLYPFNKDVSELSGLSLVVSLSILKTLKSYCHDESLTVKWPNDIVFEQKKIAGTLIEIQAETHGLSYAVIGIGINVNMEKDDDHIHQPWTSLQKILNKYIDRNELVIQLISNVLDYLNLFNNNGFSSFINEWKNADCLMNQAITLKNLQQKIEGTVVGVNEQGHLLLKMHDGKTRSFSAGDTTIVKKG